MTDKLKPCPFCGGKAYIGEMKKSAGFERWSVACINRRCIAYKFHNPFVPHFWSKESAIEAWNRRADNER